MRQQAFACANFPIILYIWNYFGVRILKHAAFPVIFTNKTLVLKREIVQLFILRFIASRL